MKQPEHRANGKINLFPELAPGISIVYRASLKPKKGRPEHRLTIRLFVSQASRTTMHINRGNHYERYNEAVERLIAAGLTTKHLADKYDGMVPWDEIINRFGLKEKKIITYDIYRPDDWVDPQLNRIGYKSEHLPRKRKKQ